MLSTSNERNVPDQLLLNTLLRKVLASHLHHCITITPGYCIVLYLLPVLNPKSYDGARVLEASGRPMLVIGRSYWVVPIQDEDVNTKAGMKLAGEITPGYDATISALGKGIAVI